MFYSFHMWLLRWRNLKLLRKIHSMSRKDNTQGRFFVSIKSSEITAMRLRNIDECFSYLCSKGFLEKSSTYQGVPIYILTDAGNNYFPDIADRRLNILVREIVLPVIVAVLTTLFTMWITDYFHVRSKVLSPAATTPAISTVSPSASPQP